MKTIKLILKIMIMTSIDVIFYPVLIPICILSVIYDIRLANNENQRLLNKIYDLSNLAYRCLKYKYYISIKMDMPVSIRRIYHDSANVFSDLTMMYGFKSYMTN